MAAQFFFALLVCVTLLSDSTAAQERAALLQKIRESHAKIREHVFEDVAVDVRMRNIRLPKGNVELEKDSSFVISGEGKMMRDGKDILASNKDYRFRLNDRDTGKQLGYLEGRRERNAAAEAYEDRLASALLLSMLFDTFPLVEVLEDGEFVVDSIREDANTTTITGMWKHDDERFEDITIQLAPNNLYQVVASKFTIRRPKYTVRVTRNYSYATKPFDGSTIRLPVTYDQEIVELVNNSPSKEAVRSEVVFSNWDRAPKDPQIFRLSGHGFPEPDLGALNSSRSPIRVVVCIFVGIGGLLLILFGRRLFRESKARG
jgi:hypothetical protein